MSSDPQNDVIALGYVIEQSDQTPSTPVGTPLDTFVDAEKLQKEVALFKRLTEKHLEESEQLKVRLFRYKTKLRQS